VKLSRNAVDPRYAGLILLWAAAPGSVWAQTTAISPQHHAWGRFVPGSWTMVRKLTEDFDEAGRLKTASTTETKTSLVAVDELGCTLRVEVTVDVAGKRFAAQPRSVRVGFGGESNGERAVTRKVGTETLEIAGARAACTVLEATIDGVDEKIVSKISYCETVPPFVLKRETLTTSKDGSEVRRRTVVDTLAAEMPYKVLAEMKTVAFLRTSEMHAQGTSYTLEVYCPDVPGGVVAHSSKESDEAGRIVRRSTLELIDYAVVDEQQAQSSKAPLRYRVRRPVLPFWSK